MPLSAKQRFVAHLTEALLYGPWQEARMLERASQAITGPHSWLDQLITSLLREFPDRQPTPWRLRETITASPFFAGSWKDKAKRPKIGGYPLFPAVMLPSPPSLADLSLPRLPTPAEVARWLNLTQGQLEWFADPLGLQGNVPEGPNHHYFYRWRKKNDGYSRLIESPKKRLKNIQRQILREILDQVPVHSAAHGFCKGKSCLSFAGIHTGQEIVARMDLEDFFPSIRPARIHAIFRTLGYPWQTARLLTGLCTHTTPDLFRELDPDKRPSWQTRKHFLQPHLPQGAPTSPGLANLCAYKLDCRLSGLARKMGLSYSRYADDLAFSGGRDLLQKQSHFRILVGSIVLEEGFRLNMRKTKFMGRGVRQRLTGLVVNNGPNIPRKEYDRLKAILHNCTYHGPDSQNLENHENFKAYLKGKISWVRSVNDARGKQLAKLFDLINWGD